MIDAMAQSDKVCEHIHFPLQSGSDRVLRAMQRSYRRERYLGWLERIRTAIPHIAVSTDVIVGFPGETEEDFEDTLDVVRRARFDQAYTFQYSPRPGTPAAEMGGQLVKAVVQERFDRLVALQEAIGLEGMREQVGSTVEVLIEGTGRKGGAAGPHPEQPRGPPRRRACARDVPGCPDRGRAPAPPRRRARGGSGGLKE